MLINILALLLVGLLIYGIVKDKKDGHTIKNEKLQKWVKALMITLIVLILGFVIMSTINKTVNTEIIKQINSIILYLLIGINVVILAVCTVISIKSKEKLPFWINILQGLLIAVVVITIITQIINGNRHQKEIDSVREQTTKIMNNYK